MLSSRVVYPEAIGSFFDCLLVFIDHIDELLALDGVNSVVAALCSAGS